MSSFYRDIRYKWNRYIKEKFNIGFWEGKIGISKSGLIIGIR